MFVSLSTYSVPNYTSKAYRDSIIKVRNEYIDKRIIEQNKEDAEKTRIIIENLDTAYCHADTTFRVGKKIVVLFKDGIKEHGLKKSIQINKELLFPIFAFLILYLVWLKNRK